MNELLETRDIQRQDSLSDAGQLIDTESRKQLTLRLVGPLGKRTLLRNGNDYESKNNAYTGGEADFEGLYDF